MEKHIVQKEEANSRRKFIQQTALLGAGFMLPVATNVFAGNEGEKSAKNILSRGYAARDSSGKVSPWSFERRPVGDNDILIDIKFSSICHTDIHALSGHWGPQQYPQVPGHEMAGIVSAIGINVTKFKIGDRAGVGCMVDSCMTCESCTHGRNNIATSMRYFGHTETLTKLLLQGLHKEVMPIIL